MIYLPVAEGNQYNIKAQPFRLVYCHNPYRILTIRGENSFICTCLVPPPQECIQIGRAANREVEHHVQKRLYIYLLIVFHCFTKQIEDLFCHFIQWQFSYMAQPVLYLLRQIIFCREVFEQRLFGIHLLAVFEIFENSQGL